MGKRKKSKKQTPQTPSRRTYAGARRSRLTFNAGTSSANSELATSLVTLRNRSRALCRDNVYAKRAKAIVVNNVIGKGIGLQAQVKSTRGNLIDRINTAIEQAWHTWALADSCHTGGALHFSDFERACLSEVFESGEAFIRLHPQRFGESRIPLALELIESERIADDYEIKPPEGANVTLGIEHDSYGRMTAIYAKQKHPNDLRASLQARFDEILRIPADQILHLRIIERWPQTRGVPWLHATITRLDQLGEYEQSAIVAARIGASKVGFFENPEGDPDLISDSEEADGTPSTRIEPGEFTSLPPGYRFTSWDPIYPHEQFDQFTRAHLRGIAAGVGVSYESLSRDYSQSNYSSSRLSLLDDRDLWRVLQQWWIRAFRDPLYKRWFSLAVIAGAIPGIDRESYALDPEKFEAVAYKPRGWGWVDPTKEVAAYKEAEKAGYATKADIIAATAGGVDIEDYVRARRRELDLLAANGIETDTTSDVSDSEEMPQDQQQDEEDDEEPAPARIYRFGINND